MSSYLFRPGAEPSTSTRWLAHRFPKRGWLIADLQRRIGRAPTPIAVCAPNPGRFGHAVERVLALDLCDRPPYPQLIANLPEPGQQRLLATAGYAPPTDASDGPWHKTAEHIPGARLFTVGSLLTVLDAAVHALRLAAPDDARAAIRAALRHQETLAACATGVRAARPAFAAFWASYTSGFQTALRSYGPVTTPLELLDGLRVADFLAGTTIIELKTGHLDDTNHLHALIDQVLTYALLAPASGHPVTAIVMYLARYHVMARYPLDLFLSRLAGKPIDTAEAGCHLAALIRTELPARRPAAH
ncbi:hypothetical protein [Micromonospora sp. NPDC006431]|uniref:hypothetical protein n=1 Tax=Micromonospora sp. NPDC006431 TaxID=3364235 RepID=UPI0036866C12